MKSNILIEQQFKRGFASDNNAGVHPEILNELQKVNIGHTLGYGDDIYTNEACRLFKRLLGNSVETYFVFTGTAANVLGISGSAKPWNSIITASTAHLATDECGAPEKNSGCKVITVDTPNGKLTCELIKRHLHGFGFEHHAQPGVISISQSTEMGTVYYPGEITAIAKLAHQNNMLLHMDGARLANAAAYLNIDFKEFTTDAGVDVLSFGGTKNGMMYGEAICFLKPNIAQDFKYVRKQGMQLASKMRFISAQFIAYFENDLWKRSASNANKAAQYLATKLAEIEEVKITQKVQSNGIFVIMPPDVAESLKQEYYFYTWNEFCSEYRLMTSWDTTEEDIDGFIFLLKKEINKKVG
jgi:threonine aldolase